MFKKSKVLIAALVLTWFLAGAIPTQAFDDHDRDRRCGQRIHSAEERLREAERKHGEHSRQAQKRRHDLEEARERCRHGDHDRDHDHR